tara:strand:- start:1073 stop:1366 length:294 start_codon:yes stop_codon:yes gene_type:complete
VVNSQKKKRLNKLMLTNIIYLAVFIILAFVLSIAVKAITRGVEAKQIIKEEKNELSSKQSNISSMEIIDQINELKNLHEKGVLSDEEFKRAKEKILK